MLRALISRLAVLLSVCPAVHLSAQSSEDRAALEALRDSLVAVTDSVALRRLEVATIEVAKQDRDDPLIHLRLGFIAYRLGEIGAAKSHFDDAAGEFEWAAELRPDWPYAWYGLGLAELAAGEHSSIAIENLRQVLGKDYLSKAAHSFARAVQADPAFAQATIDLVTTALAQRIQPRLGVALEAVRLAAASTAGGHPEVQLARGRVEREVGEVDSALAGFRAYLEAGGDSGVGSLELARTLYFARRPGEGWRTYLAGARAAASPEALALYRADFGWVVVPAELAAFDSLGSPEARAAWLERFWGRRDVMEARTEGERLAEHYRRWFYAKRHFRLVSRHRHYDITERYRSAQSEFDDRGIIYLRHGEPDQQARFTSLGVEPNESWLYRRAEGNLMFHFVARDDVSDYKLVESLADVLGFRAAVRAQGGRDSTVAALYATRDQLDPIFRRVGDGASSVGPALAEERRQGRKSLEVGTTSDSYRQQFEERLDVVVSDFVVGDSGGGDGGGDPDAGGQALHLVFAIPAERLTPMPGADGVLYPLQFRAVVADADDRPIARLDTTRVFAAREPLRGGSFLTGRLALPVPAGRYRYRLLVTTVDHRAGDLVRRDSVEVAPLDGRRFAASDLVVGRQGSGLIWALPGDTVLLNPLGRFPERSSAELYYEVYGLPRGAPYHTVVRLEREGGRSLFGAIRGLFGGRRAPVLLEFDAASEGPVTRVHRGVDFRDAPRGSYVLTVLLTDPATAVTFTRTRRLHIVSR